MKRYIRVNADSLNAKTPALLLAALLAISGCQLNRAKDQQTELLRQSMVPVRTSVSDCTLYLNQFDDQRQSKSLGDDNFSVNGEMVDQWVREGLKKAGIQLDSPNDSAALQLTLTRTYLQSIQGNLSANVVFAARYRAPDTQEFSSNRIFRGQQVSADWQSEAESVETALIQAIDIALSRIGKTYSLECEARQKGV